MKAARNIMLAIWHFVVGDDWLSAVTIVLLIACTALLAAASVPVWFILPIGVITVMAVSVQRASRGH